MEEAEETFKQAEILIERDVIRTRCTFSDTTNKTQQNTEPLRYRLYMYIYIHTHMYIYYH